MLQAPIQTGVLGGYRGYSCCPIGLLRRPLQARRSVNNQPVESRGTVVVGCQGIGHDGDGRGDDQRAALCTLTALLERPLWVCIVVDVVNSRIMFIEDLCLPSSRDCSRSLLLSCLLLGISFAIFISFDLLLVSSVSQSQLGHTAGHGSHC
jgi:hypothetical protein